MAENNSGTRQRVTTKRARSGGKIGCLGAMLYFLMVIGVSALLAGFAWLCADDVLALTKEDVVSVIEVSETDTIDDIADKLVENGVIKYGWLFKLYAGFSNAEEKIDPGSYQVSSIMDYRAVVYAMRDTSDYRTIVTVTIPEGFTLEQILERLEEEQVNSYQELKETCDSYDFEYSFLADLPLEEGRLEGYLFPDTYDFYVNEGAISAINKLLSNFNRRLTAEMRETAEEMGYTLHEILTIASLIEKEAANSDEMSTISSVIHNRLGSSEYKLLQIDATVQYALPERKEKLSYEDLQYDSPYNTYLYEGLPPGPICSPGLAAIRAALNPANTDYYFYALTEDGTHEFARTAEEHQAIIDANPGVYD